MRSIGLGLKTVNVNIILWSVSSPAKHGQDSLPFALTQLDSQCLCIYDSTSHD